jgi:sterol desaturase/sphingolipid hydroxylase (fatty acid hydroxylase superfamily)
MTELQTFVINPFYCSFFVYWGLSFIFFLADIGLDNKKYRIEPNIDWKLYNKTLYHVLYLQFCYSLPIMYMLIPFWKWRNITIEYNESNHTDIIKLITSGLLGESIFFYLHYWSHFILYPKIHKVHHEWKNTCAIAAAYAHPIEYICVSLPSFLFPPMITGLNWYYSNIWFMIATTSVVIDHSGYNIINASKFHWDHHKYSNVNYGTNTIGDVIHFFIKKYSKNYN